MNFDREKDSYKIEGISKCRGERPKGNRCYWKRARSGRGTIYLYRNGPESAKEGSESDNAFGWIPEHIAQTIYNNRLNFGWCDIDTLDKSVIFTDNLSEFPNPPYAVGPTDFLKQRNRHWVTGEPLPIPGQQTETKETEMANVDYAGNARKIGFTLGNNNKQGAISAAYLEAGSLATKQLVKAAKKALPLAARGYAETVLGQLVIANIAQLAIQHARPGDVQLGKLADAMVSTAYLDLIRTVDLDSIIDQMLEGTAIKNALARASKEDSTAT